MSKRVAGIQLTADNTDEIEGEREEAGNFQVASEEELRKRVFKTARRARTAEGKSEGTGGVFANLRNSYASKTTVTLESVPLSSASSCVYSMASATTSASHHCEGTDGSYKFGKSSSWTSSYGSTSSVSTTTSFSSESRKSSEYMEKLRELNQSVSSWISRHVKENPYVDLTPVFNDYRKYWNSIESTYNVGSSVATSLPDPASAQRDPVGVATRQLGVGSSGRSDPLGNTSQVKRVQDSGKASSVAFSLGTGGSTTLPQQQDRQPLQTTSLKMPFQSTSTKVLFPSTSQPKEQQVGLQSAGTGFSLFSTSGTSSTLPATSMIQQQQQPPKAPPGTSGVTTPTQQQTALDSSSHGLGPLPATTGSTLPANSTATQPAMAPGPVATDTTTAPTSSELKMALQKTSTAAASAPTETVAEPDQNGDSPDTMAKKQDEDALYSCRARLLYDKNKELVDIGIGTLKVQSTAGQVVRLLLRNDSSLRTVLLNINVTAQTPVRTNKNYVLIMVPIPNPELEITERPVCYLLRVKTPDGAQELLKVIKEQTGGS